MKTKIKTKNGLSKILIDLKQTAKSPHSRFAKGLVLSKHEIHHRVTAIQNEEKFLKAGDNFEHKKNSFQANRILNKNIKSFDQANLLFDSSDKNEDANSEGLSSINKELRKYKLGEYNQDDRIINKIMANRGIDIRNAELDPYDKSYDLRRIILQNENQIINQQSAANLQVDNKQCMKSPQKKGIHRLAISKDELKVLQNDKREYLKFVHEETIKKRRRPLNDDSDYESSSLTESDDSKDRTNKNKRKTKINK